MVKNEIKVFARLKPETKRRNIVNYQIYRRAKKNVEEDYLVLNGMQKSINEYINNRPESWKFAFYKIFDNDIKQDEIFENVAQPVVQSVLNGYNATIFAYGQTGSGKTFSITGDAERYEDRGVLPRTIEYLFETIKKNPDNLYSVEIAYLEIYNENGYDLLDPKHEVVTKLEDLPRVTIQEDETGTLHLKNLSFRNVENEKDALALLFLGDTNRAISETPMNPQSSRSHCIFTIAVSVKQSGAKHLTKAKMHLVDLAGSERVYKCCISGTILTEAKHINLSLHYLEQVIVCLGQQNVTHIPYRNSLLTAILRDSLGGNCLTTMLATLSLNTSNLEETISTCRFSQRVALIKNDVNLILERNPEDENRFLKIEIERLKDRIAHLTKLPANGQELTVEEKQNLKIQVRKFLQSDIAAIDWDNDERKIKYCLQILRENFRTQNLDKLNCVREPDKDLNYYRNLVVQRDKEISALINMLKKTSRNSVNDSADDPGPFINLENRKESNLRISTTRKKARFRDLMVEARSIAELIKNGKATIGDLKTRMKNSNPDETKTLHETLQLEQSKLDRNLSSLTMLKTEAARLKTALIEENEDPKNVIDDSLFSPMVDIDSKYFCTDDNDCNKKHVASSRASPLPARDPGKQSGKNEDIVECKVVDNPSVERLDNDCGISIPKMENPDQVPNRPADLKIQKSETVSLRKPCSDGDLERNLFSKMFLDTETLHRGESRRSSFRPPLFLRGMLHSHDNFDYGSKCSPRKESNDLNLRDVGIETLTKMVQGFRANLSRPDTIIPVTQASESITNSARFENSRAQDSCNYDCLDDDSSSRKSSRTSSSIKVSDQLHETSIDDERLSKEDSERSDNRMEASIFSGNIKSNETKVDEMTKDNDSCFIKSLPLTGDPEIDEEIIAFYRAKKTGGTY